MTQHTEQNEIDYWNGEWIVGAEVLVTDGDWSIGWGKIIEISKDNPYWSKVELEDGKIVDAYKSYCYKKNKTEDK